MNGNNLVNNIECTCIDICRGGEIHTPKKETIIFFFAK